MFTEEKKKYIEAAYASFAERCPERASELWSFFGEISSDEALCLKFSYAYMPQSDVVSLDTDTVLEFVRYALKARAETPWGKTVPMDLFLNFVLFYRINNEHIECHRNVFYSELYPRIKGLDMHGAVLEVNYWCFEKATYREADDRTLSPLGVIRGARGRCGEESTLTVAALRAVGIPARQCYTPRWAHCDDNHAWVEAWVDGKWHYLGACEPEATLDRGWFTAAASKAMLVYAKAFSHDVGDELITARMGIYSTINNMSTYGETRELTVHVSENGKSLENITVRFELLNYSEMFSILTLKTDSDGNARLLMGLGDIFVHATDGKRFTSRKVDMRECDSLELDFSQAVLVKSEDEEFEMRPPHENVSLLSPAPAKLQAAHERRMRECGAIREKFEATFFGNSEAKKICEKYGEYSSEFAKMLVYSKGNHAEILSFLESDFSSQEKYETMKSLREKDFTDITSNTLEEYTRAPLLYKNNFESDVYINAILAPRVQNEMILGEREFILSYFQGFGNSPKNAAEVWNYIESNIKIDEEFDYPGLVASAVGILTYKISNATSADVLFVSICRSLGIPARLSAVTGEKEYFSGGKFLLLQGELGKGSMATLKIVNKSEIPLSYFSNFSLARLQNGVYESLAMWGLTIENSFEKELPCGSYRVTLSTRQIDGACLARNVHFELEENGASISLALRGDELDKKLLYAPLENETFGTTDGGKTDLFSEIGEGAALLAYLEVGGEPTEHLFNELIELEERYNENEIRVLMIVKSGEDLKNKTLIKMKKAFPFAKFVYAESGEYLESLHEIMGVGDRRLPFALATCKRQGLIAFSNYNVGTAASILRIIDCAKAKNP